MAGKAADRSSATGGPFDPAQGIRLGTRGLAMSEARGPSRMEPDNKERFAIFDNKLISLSLFSWTALDLLFGRALRAARAPRNACPFPDIHFANRSRRCFGLPPQHDSLTVTLSVSEGSPSLKDLFPGR